MPFTDRSIPIPDPSDKVVKYFLSTLALFAAASNLCPAAQTEDAGKCLHVYILTGQSNSLGAVKGDPVSDDILAHYSTARNKDTDGVQMWDGNMAGSLTEPTTGGSAWSSEGKTWMTVQPQATPMGRGLHGPAGTPYESLIGQADLRRDWEGGYGRGVMGPEYGFAYMMQKKGWQTGRRDSVAVIKVSRDGGSNDNWVKPTKPGTANGYTFLLRSVVQALRSVDPAIYSSVRTEGLLYLQGETGRPTHAARACSVLEGLTRNLRADVAAALPEAAERNISFPPGCLVAGEPAAWGTNEPDSCPTLTGQKLLARAASNDCAGFVHTRDLGKISAGDTMGVHYDGNSQLTIGARFAYAVAAAQGLDTTEGGSVRVRSQQFGDTDMDASAAPVFLNDAVAWWQSRGDAVAYSPDSFANAVAVWDLSSANMEAAAQKTELLSADLTVRGLRIEDPYADDDTAGTHNATVHIRNSPDAQGVLSVGPAGIELQRGNLCICTELRTRGAQSWRVAGGKLLDVRGPVSGDGNISLARHDAAGPPARIDLHDARDTSGRTWYADNGLALRLPGDGFSDSSLCLCPSASVSLSGDTVTIKRLEMCRDSALHLKDGIKLSADRVRLDAAVTLVFDAGSGRFSTLNAADITATSDTVINIKLDRLPVPLRAEYSLGTGWSHLSPLLAPSLPDGFRLRVERDGTLLLSCPDQAP